MNDIGINYGSGNVGTAAATDRDTFLSPLHRTHSSVNELMARVQLLHDRLLGAAPPQPTNSVEAKLQSVPSGLFEEIAARGGDMDRKVNRMHELLSRLESALP